MSQYVNNVCDRANVTGVTASPVYHVVCRGCNAGESVELSEFDARTVALLHEAETGHNVTYERVDQ